MPVDHVGISVPKDRFKEILDFYLAALAPLGYKVIAQPIPDVVGLGKDVPDWWLAAADAAPARGSLHVAFSTMSMWCPMLRFPRGGEEKS